MCSKFKSWRFLGGGIWRVHTHTQTHTACISYIFIYIIFFSAFSLMEKERQISLLGRTMPWIRRATWRFWDFFFFLYCLSSLPLITPPPHTHTHPDLTKTWVSIWCRNCQLWAPVWLVLSRRPKRRKRRWTISQLKGWDIIKPGVAIMPRLKLDLFRVAWMWTFHWFVSKLLVSVEQLQRSHLYLQVWHRGAGRSGDTVWY